MIHRIFNRLFDFFEEWTNRSYEAWLKAGKFDRF
jgi:hypothetical protein